MQDVVKKTPIPVASLALGLASLGKLLQPYSEVCSVILGLLALFFMLLLSTKAVLYPKKIREDLRNSSYAATSAMYFMCWMQLATYLAPFAYYPAFALWAAAIAAYVVLMVWFSCVHMRRFDLKEVLPSYFICYVGIIVASTTSPVFAMEQLGFAIFCFGFACFLVLLPVVTLRYFKNPVPEPARPLFCIYAAPFSLSLVGYLETVAEPNFYFATVLFILAQTFLVLVVLRLPIFLRFKFYPTFAAMTFPFVISAIALGKMLELLSATGVNTFPAGEIVCIVESVIAVGMVTFVTIRYAVYLFGKNNNVQQESTS